MSVLSDSSSAPNCTICFEDVVDNKEKGIAKLKCGHIFHLVCIGTWFNVHNGMQCPVCRDLETGDPGWRVAEPRQLTAQSFTDLLVMAAEYVNSVREEDVLSPEPIDTRLTPMVPPNLHPFHEVLTPPLPRADPRDQNEGHVIGNPIDENYINDQIAAIDQNHGNNQVVAIGYPIEHNPRGNETVAIGHAISNRTPVQAESFILQPPYPPMRPGHHQLRPAAPRHQLRPTAPHHQLRPTLQFLPPGPSSEIGNIGHAHQSFASQFQEFPNLYTGHRYFHDITELMSSRVESSRRSAQNEDSDSDDEIGIDLNEIGIPFEDPTRSGRDD